MANAQEFPSARPAGKAKLAASILALLVAIGAILRAYTDAANALKEAVKATKTAEAEPVAASGYQELAKHVEEMSAQQLAIHDDLIALRGYVEGLVAAGNLPPPATAPAPATSARPAVPAVRVPPALPPSAARPTPPPMVLPMLKSDPKAVHPPSVVELRRRSALPQVE